MNLKSLTAGLLIALSTVAPAFADTTHLDLSVGSVQERVLVNNVENVSSVTARVSKHVNHRVEVYGLASESYVNRSSNNDVAGTQYSALTGALGLTYALNRHTGINVEGGTRVNDQQILPGAATNIPYIGASVTTRVF